MLKADAEGANWTDRQIAGVFDYRTKTVENLRRQLVEHGFEVPLNGVERISPPTAKRLDGEQAAQIIAMRLGSSPAGHTKWSLRRLARKVVTASSMMTTAQPRDSAHLAQVP